MPQPPPDNLPAIERLREVMRTLRSDQGCPWDREQTVETLKPFLVEETYEVLDAIDSGDRGKLCEELGDVLLQVVFQSQLCSEDGSFTFDDVATAITEKLIRRHPHVFGDVDVADAAEVLKNWDEIKKSEKGDAGPRSALEGIPRSLPALHKAHEVQKRAARQGFDWDDLRPVLDKLEEELNELKAALEIGPDHTREELGDLLFSAVNLSRFLGHQPEEVLHESIAKFTRRFQAVEDRVHAAGKSMTDCSLRELDAVWDEVKVDENN